MATSLETSVPPARPKSSGIKIAVHDRYVTMLWLTIALGCLLRFPTLGQQSFWYDEVVTSDLIGKSFSDLLRAVPDSESTPPLYYMMAWIWAKSFGTAEAGLRSLSALFGVAVIPVAYMIAAKLRSARAGCIAALLTALSPLLVWYSQEARAYSLLVLLSSLSALFFLP